MNMVLVVACIFLVVSILLLAFIGAAHKHKHTRRVFVYFPLAFGIV